METRLLAAYVLIGLLLLAGSLLVRRIVVRTRKHRRLMRGHGQYEAITRRG